jgi:hypothetical protein
LLYEKPEERLMPIAKITGQGLAAIACSVALLWGFIAGEKLTVRHARKEYAQTMRDLRQLQLRTQPVSMPAPAPAPQSPRPGRLTLG